MKKTSALFVFTFLFVAVCLSAKNDKKLIYKINISENIGSRTWVYLHNGLHEALRKKADCIILHINTYGGSIKEADSMRTDIINAPLPVYAFIDNNAASAGALIAIACDSIYMRKSATMGAATVVTMNGAAAPDKYQSYMRGMIRATAETHGQDTIIRAGDTLFRWKRDPQIAEAMVDNKIIIPGLVDSTQVLTLTANQAVELGYCDGIVENIDEVATRYLHYKQYTTENYNPTFYDKIKGFLTGAILQSVLIMLIIGGIYWELHSPVVGFPSAITITAAILYFLPLYLDGYAQNWEILIFVLGLIFIVFEIFVIPGFGIAGISGIVLVITGLFLAMIGNISFNFESVPISHFYQSILTLIAGLGMSLFLIIYMSSRIGKKGFLKNAALHADQKGYISVSMEPALLVGKEGKAATILRPSGRIEINGQYYDAISTQGFIEEGETVIINKYKNSQLYVSLK